MLWCGLGDGKKVFSHYSEIPLFSYTIHFLWCGNWNNNEKIISLLICLGLASGLAHANESPNAKNFNKSDWGLHVAGSDSSQGIFLIFNQKSCSHKYKGKLQGIESKVALRQATIFLDDEGSPGKIIGKGCWSATVEDQEFEYLGYQGEFNTEKNGRILEIPWSKMFNASQAG